MSNTNNTVARPYAKAIFEYALEHQQLAEWSTVLDYLTQVASSPMALPVLRGSDYSPEQQTELLLSVLKQLQNNTETKQIKNLLGLLAENKRLSVIPNIKAQYDSLRDTHEKTMMVDVVSFAPLTNHQEEQLIKRLTQRLQRSVTLNISLDQSLLGGMIIRADNLVFDASVATQIKKLAANLAA